MARRGGGGIRLPDAGDVQQVGTRSDPGVNVPNLGIDIGGIDVSGFTDAVSRAAEKQQRLLDATKTAEAYEAYGRTSTDDFNRRRLEEDPSNPEFLKSFTGFLDQGVETTISSLPDGVSETAKAELRIRLSSQRNAFLDSAGAVHLGALQDHASAAIDGMTNTWAAQAMRDPALVDGILDLADEGLAPFADSLPAAMEEKKRADARAAIIESSVNGLIDMGGLDAARAMLGSDKYNADLDPNRRAVLGNRIDAEQKRRAAEAKAAAREQRAMFLADFQIRLRDEEAARARGTSTGMTDTEIRTALSIDEAGSKLAERTIADLNATQQLANDMTAMALMPPEEQAALVNSYAPAGEGFAGEAQRYDALRKAQDQLNTTLVKNPVEYVLTYNKGAAEAYRDMADPDPAKRKDAASRYATIMESEQVRLGLRQDQVKLLTDAHADQIAAQFQQQGAGGQSAADLSATLADQWGDRWPQVYGELSKKLPSAAVVIASGMAPGPAGMLAEAAKTGAEALKKTLPSESVKTIGDAVATQLAPFAATVIGVPGGANTLATYRENTELLALQYAARGDDPTTAARKAATDTVNRNYEFRGTYRVPIAISAANVGAGAQQVLATLEGAALDIPQSLTGLPEPDTRAAYLSAVKNTGYWVTAPDESGLVLYDSTDTAVTVDGRPLKFTWKELIDAAFAAPAEPATGMP